MRTLSAQCRRRGVCLATTVLAWVAVVIILVLYHVEVVVPSPSERLVKVDGGRKSLKSRLPNVAHLAPDDPIDEKSILSRKSAFDPDRDDDLIEDGIDWRLANDPASDKGHSEVVQKAKRPDGGVLLDDVQGKDVPRAVDCVINDGEVVECLRRGGDVYLPFSFIRSYFEVEGEMRESGGGDADSRYDQHQAFHFYHALQAVYQPTKAYSPAGSFLFFSHYNVAGRDKVMCISAKDGIPVSNQWSPNGYYYPIQIVQYGLSHYSQYTEDGPLSDNDRRILEAGEGAKNWVLPDGTDAESLRSLSVDGVGPVLQFRTSTITSGLPYLRLPEDSSMDVCLSFDVQFMSSESSVLIVFAGTAGEFTIAYSASEALIHIEDGKMAYGLGANAVGKWKTVRRDILVDARKLLFSRKRAGGRAARGGGPTPIFLTDLQRVDRVVVSGHGLIDNITLAATCHMGHFLDAADWMVREQDANGSWPIPVKRAWNSINTSLAPGWYSAMAQGHALSILTRAYIATGDQNYARAAERALAIYQKTSTRGGIVATFMARHDWYEEYPTTPPLFVLNGFMYSLFGLYDLKEMAARQAGAVTGAAASAARDLWKAGLASLKAMLPFYDSGTGSFYDLRHYTMGVAPNRARWEYHAVHIGQLAWLGTVDTDPVFNKTAARWLGYMKGELAAHN